MLDRLTVERMRWTADDAPVLVALSGGGDSVALLHLLVEALGVDRVRAAIVDHALREGSEDDAVRAKGFAEALGVGGEILTLTWPEGANRAQQAARTARYRALCEHARREGLAVIAAAHTADDQAETVLMRAANGSTWRGLAGIAPFAFAPVWPEGRGIVLARPLLGVRRVELRAYLRNRGAAWIEDPANANPMFERVRIRARLAELEAQSIDPMRLVHLAARLRQRADALDSAALELIARAATVNHTVHIAHNKWNAPREVRCRALAVLMAAAAGASREPPAAEMEALEGRVMDPGHPGSTHGGVSFVSVQGGVMLGREPSAVMGRADGATARAPLHLPVGEEVVWDGRLAVTALMPGWRAVPARSAEAVAFENNEESRRLGDVRGIMEVRPLVAARVRHAFAPDVNRTKAL